MSRGKVPFIWGHEQEEAFVTFKESLTSAPVLGFYDKEAPISVIVNTSPLGLGAFLVHKQSNGWRIILYGNMP